MLGRAQDAIAGVTRAGGQETGISRRDIARLVMAMGAAASMPQRGAAQSTNATKLILLGTKGGPTPSPLRAQTANAVVIDGHFYVIDCGSGVALQLVKAGVSLAALGNIFLTHLHSDHAIDAGALPLLAWASGLKTPVDLYGPPGLGRMVDDFADMNKVDIEARMREEGRPPFRELLRTHEFDDARLVMQDERVRVTSLLVDHYTLKPSFAFRFETKDRTIVFSGDTTYFPPLADFAKGADVLVHEVMYMPALERLLKSDNNAAALMDHLLKSHTATTQVGKIAARAGVKTLVLSHFVPGGDPSITDDMWMSDIRKDFSGEIIAGKDLQVI